MGTDGKIRAMEYMKDLLDKPLVGEVIAILLREPDDVFPTNVFSRISRRCLHATDWGEIAMITVGVTCYHPPAAGRWVDELLSPLLCEGEGFEPPFAFGAILGFFRTGVWLCDNWRSAGENFWTKWPSLLQKLIFSPWLLVLPPNDEGVCFPNDRYGGELTNAVRGFLGHSRSPDEGRLYKCFQICNGVWRRQVQDADLTPMGRLLLDHLTYYIFGHIPATSRAKALSVWHRQMLADARRHATSSQTG